MVTPRAECRFANHADNYPPASAVSVHCGDGRAAPPRRDVDGFIVRSIPCENEETNLPTVRNKERFLRYPEQLIAIMREDLTKYGIAEARTAEEVDRLLAPESGTVLMVINSVCGCAAGKARPGVGLALKHSVIPDRVATVFAGGDVEATTRLRERLSGYPPSSPSIALFRDGTPVWIMHRHEIEAGQSLDVAARLKAAFDEYCRQTQTGQVNFSTATS
jgi:putative YphP/YqiW family bacilliredoxin